MAQLTTRLHAFSDAKALGAYLELWGASPYQSVFGHPVYLQAVADLVERDTVWVGVYNDEDVLVAATPLIRKKAGPYIINSLPPLTPFLSPILRTVPRDVDFHHRETAFDALLDYLGRESQTTLSLHPAIADMRPFVWASWDVSPKYTYVVNLKEHEDLLTSWSQSARNIARSEAKHFTIVNTPEFADKAISFMLESYRKSGATLNLDVNSIAAFVSKLLDAGMAHVHSAQEVNTNEIVASAITLEDHSTGYYWIAGSRHNKAMTVLIANILSIYRTAGKDTFDFVGANVPSIAEFKRSFGGTLQIYFRAKKVNRLMLKLAPFLRS